MIPPMADVETSKRPMWSPVAVPLPASSARWLGVGVLAVQSLLLGITASAFAPALLVTPAHIRGLVAFAILVLLLLTGILSLLFAYPVQLRLSTLAKWVAARRVRTWTAAFLFFEVFTLTGQALDKRPIFTRDAELMGAAGFIGAAAILAARHLFLPSDEAEAKEALFSRLKDWHLLVIIGGTALAMSAVIWFYAAPLGYGNFDSYRIFYASEGLLGRESLFFDWYTYPYPLFIAVTRLVADTILSVVVVQHFVRIGFALLIFWLLKDTDRAGAGLAGLAVALSPINAYQAHLLLNGGLYAIFVSLITVIAYRVSQKDRPVRVRALLSLGLFTAFTSLWRPVAQFLILPLVLIAGMVTWDWKRPAWITGGFGAGVLLLSLGQVIIDGHFRFGTDAELFYAYGLVYHDMYSPDNGPMAAAFQRMFDEGECDYQFPDPRYEIANTWPHDLHRCAERYNAVHDAILSSKSLYLEAIRARPFRWMSHLYEETRYYFALSDTGPLQPGRFNQLRYFYQSFALVDGCAGEKPVGADIEVVDSWLTYTCTYQPDQDSFLANFIPDSYNAILLTMQPYRLQGTLVWARWWAALALLVFTWLEAPRRLRLFIFLIGLVMIYHAGVTSGIMFSEPRYVYYVAPLFSILVGIIILILWRGFRTLETLPAQASFIGILFTLPVLPSLIAPIWADTVWTGHYYQTPDLSGSPALTREDSVVTFEWGEDPPLEGWETDGFSVRWERSEIFEAKTYQFAVRADDGARVYLDGELTLDLWGPGFHDWTAVEREMKAGRHRLIVEYYDETGSALIQFGYFPVE